MAEKIYQGDEILAIALKTSPRVVKSLDINKEKFKKTIYWVSSMPTDLNKIMVGDKVFCLTPKGYMFCSIVEIKGNTYKVKKPWVYTGWVSQIFGIVTFSVLE